MNGLSIFYEQVLLRALAVALLFPVAIFGQSGTVKSGNQPIPGATVWALRGDVVLTTVTTETGGFTLNGMEPGNWKVGVDMFGFEPVQREVEVTRILTTIAFTLQMRDALQPPRHETSDADVVSQSRGDVKSRTDTQFGLRQGPSLEVAPDRSTVSRNAEIDDSILISSSLSKGLKAHSRITELVGNHTKAEENPLHGMFFLDPGSSALNAAPFSLNGQKINKPISRQNRFGLNIGGRLEIPNVPHLEKTVFFVGYTGDLQQIGYSPTTTVPAIAERNGDFSGTGYAIYDPVSGQPFARNVIPAFRVSPIARGLMQYIPLPNQPGSVQNYRLSLTRPNTAQILNARGTQTLSHKDELGVGFARQDRTTQTVSSYGFLDRTYGNGLNASVSWSHTFVQRLLNIVTSSSNRSSGLTIPYFAHGADVAIQMGIQGTARNPNDYGPPNVNFTNFGALTDSSPSRIAIHNFGISDQLTLNIGKHNWSFGAGYNQSFNNTVNDANGRGTFTFTGLSTGAVDTNGQRVSGTGYDFADFLLGLPQSASIGYGNSNTYFRNNSYFAFGQDDYRALANLTLNLGLRYEYFSPWTEKYGRIANLVMTPNFKGITVVTPSSAGVPSGLIRPDRNNFAPRLGLAWKPSTKGTITARMGYALYYDAGVYDRFLPRLAAQPPFAIASVVNASSENGLTLATGLMAKPSINGITNTFAVNMDYRDMYAQSWNLSIQSDLPGSWLAAVTYLGTKGTHLDIQGVPNRAPSGASFLATEPTPLGNAGAFVYDTPEGSSIYHAAQVRLTRQFHRGFSANFLYTYSKSIDNSSALAGTTNALAQDFYNLRAERGLSSFDRRHSLNLDYVWALPFVGGGSSSERFGWIGRVLKDWTASGNLMLTSGTPLTAQAAGNQVDVAGTGIISNGRASASGLRVNTSSGFFNPQAFTVPAAGQYGNAGRNTIPGPRMFLINASLQHTLRIGGRKRLQFRVDSTNVTNHVNIVSLGTIVNSITYGLPSAAGGMRTLVSNFSLLY